MKLGLLGSTETHRGTRWAHKWAFAVRDPWAGEFEFLRKESRYATTDQLPPPRRRGELEAINHHFERLGAAVKAILGVLKAFHLCSSFI
ncbi:hypothetical protein E3N88_33622 [Mikania micrantha]|uniref:Uncharacterized protein n=1 Tax=Mikania micrantha TaxID=192012 RepID=A0A5N6MD47_9ASTR|nr:hypothetical protein E3N88_33622 [Mikania micrantha]